MKKFLLLFVIAVLSVPAHAATTTVARAVMVDTNGVASPAIAALTLGTNVLSAPAGSLLFNGSVLSGGGGLNGTNGLDGTNGMNGLNGTNGLAGVCSIPTQQIARVFSDVVFVPAGPVAVSNYLAWTGDHYSIGSPEEVYSINLSGDRWSIQTYGTPQDTSLTSDLFGTWSNGTVVVSASHAVADADGFIIAATPAQLAATSTADRAYAAALVASATSSAPAAVTSPGAVLLGELRRGIIGSATNLDVKLDMRFTGTGCVQWVSAFLESSTNFFLSWCENPTHSITTNCVVGVGRMDLTGNPIGSATYPLANDLTNSYSIGSLLKTSAGSYLLSYDARNPGNGAPSTYPLIVLRSTNAGTSWIKSTTLTSSGSSYRVTSPGDMAQVGATIFLPVYWSNDGGAHDNAGYVTSTDDGQTWTTNPVALATWTASTNSISEASFFAPQSTNLIAWLRNDTSSTLYYSTSSDTGVTWSALANTLVPSMLHARAAAVDQSNNVLVVRSTGASGYQLTTMYRFSTPASLTNAVGQTIDARGSCQYGSPMRLPNQQVALLYCISTNVWNNFARMALAYVALAPGVSPLGDAFLIGPAAAVQAWQTPFIYYTSGTAAQTLPTWCPGYGAGDYQYNYGFTTNGFPICTAYATAPSTATQVIWRFDAAFQAGMGTDHWLYAATSFLTPTTSVHSTSDSYKSNTYFYGSSSKLVAIYDTNTCAGGYPVQFYLRKPGTQSSNGGWTNNNPAIWLGVGVRFNP